MLYLLYLFWQWQPGFLRWHRIPAGPARSLVVAALADADK